MPHFDYARMERIIRALADTPKTLWQRWYERNRARLRLPESYGGFLAEVRQGLNYFSSRAFPGFRPEFKPVFRELKDWLDRQRDVGRLLQTRDLDTPFRQTAPGLLRFVPTDALRNAQRFQLWLKRKLRAGDRTVLALVQDQRKFAGLLGDLIGAGYDRHYVRAALRAAREEGPLRPSGVRVAGDTPVGKTPSYQSPARYVPGVVPSSRVHVREAKLLEWAARKDRKVAWALSQRPGNKRADRIIAEVLGYMPPPGSGIHELARTGYMQRRVNNTRLPFGKAYKGVRLGDLPDHYLAYLYENYAGIENGTRVDPKLQHIINKAPGFKARLGEFFGQTWVIQMLAEFHGADRGFEGRSAADLRRDDPFDPRTWGRGLSRAEISSPGFAVSDAHQFGGRRYPGRSGRVRIKDDLTAVWERGLGTESDYTARPGRSPGAPRGGGPTYRSIGRYGQRDPEINPLKFGIGPSPGSPMRAGELSDQARRRERRRQRFDWELGFGSSRPEDWETGWTSRERREHTRILHRGRKKPVRLATGETLAPTAMSQWKKISTFLDDPVWEPYTEYDLQKGLIQKWRRRQRFAAAKARLRPEFVEQYTMTPEYVSAIAAYEAGLGEEEKLERSVRGRGGAPGTPMRGQGRDRVASAAEVGDLWEQLEESEELRERLGLRMSEGEELVAQAVEEERIGPGTRRLQARGRVRAVRDLEDQLALTDLSEEMANLPERILAATHPEELDALEQYVLGTHVQRTYGFIPEGVPTPLAKHIPEDDPFSGSLLRLIREQRSVVIPGNVSPK